MIHARALTIGWSIARRSRGWIGARSEKMLRDDGLYKWGVFVEHNPAAAPGAGSCIFLHIWKDSTTPTTGCTAMAEKDLVKLLRWLDPAPARSWCRCHAIIIRPSKPSSACPRIDKVDGALLGR